MASLGSQQQLTSTCTPGEIVRDPAVEDGQKHSKQAGQKHSKQDGQKHSKQDGQKHSKQAGGAICSHCTRRFPSRTKMFKHLRGEDGGEECMAKARDAGMPIAKQTERVAVLLVYAADRYTGTGSSYQGGHWQSGSVHGEVEHLLWRAAHVVDGCNGAPSKIARLTRASRTDRGLHSLGNVVCLSVKKIVDPSAARVWVQQINAQLPDDICVLGRWPVENEFHAKTSADRRRYEMMVPLHTLVAENPVAAAKVAERSAQAEWRWEQSVRTTESREWTLVLPPSNSAVVTFNCTPAGLAAYVPAAAAAWIHCALPRPVLLTDYVYTEWWQQLIEGHGLGPSVQLVLGVSGSTTDAGDVAWFTSTECYQTVSALDSYHQREWFVCQPYAARMRWRSLDRATCSVLVESESRRLPRDTVVSYVGWLVQGADTEATALRFSGLRLAECLLHGPFTWHADATTTDRLHTSYGGAAIDNKTSPIDQATSPEHKRLRPAGDDIAAMQSEQQDGDDAKAEAAGIRHWDLYRIRLLARLKSLIKQFQGGKLHAYHNFSEGVSSTESRAKKRAKGFRFYCRGIMQLGSSLECVILTFQTLEDGFLYNQLRKIAGLLVAIARGDVPESYIRLALDENVVLPVPCAPVHLGAMVDCIYSRKIVRAKLSEPGEIKQPTGDRDMAVNFNSYRKHETALHAAKLLAHMAELERSVDLSEAEAAARASTGGSENAVMIAGRWDQWVQNELYDESSATCVSRMTRELTFYQSKKHPVSGSVCHVPISVSVPVAFRYMLCLLREAEQSGRWPASSISRRNVIDKNSRQGESFALGRMPAHLKQPTANELFPELMQAAIALEYILLPTRPPSSTVVVNKHAQFKPHKDSGAGAGQHVSMIVGLGEYSGGELVVEGAVNDIRYKALEFDGWNQRHWTLPFDGERFSIVWFTPLGCEDVAPTRSEVAEAVSACEEAFATRAGAMVARLVPDERSSTPAPSLEQPQWAVELHGHKQVAATAPAEAASAKASGGCYSVLMPLVGIGTYRVHGSDTSKVVKTALDAGCRLIDTAASYCNEAEIGAVLRDERSLRGGRAVRREHIFLTSKLRPQDAGYEKTKKAFNASLDKLGVDYLDLYLIHWPGTAKLGPTSPTHNENRLGSWVINASFTHRTTLLCVMPTCVASADDDIRAMQELQASKKVRAIGVSNFTIAHLKELMRAPGTHTIPAVNQVEFHPLLYSVQRPLLQFCRDHGIVVQAYAPFGSKDGVSQLLSHPTLTAIASKYGVTAAEVTLRWALNHGVSVIPKSSHPERVRANAAPSLLSAQHVQPTSSDHSLMGAADGPDIDRVGGISKGRNWWLSAEDMEALNAMSGSGKHDHGAPHGGDGTAKRFCWDPSNIV